MSSILLACLAANAALLAGGLLYVNHAWANLCRHDFFLWPFTAILATVTVVTYLAALEDMALVPVVLLNAFVWITWGYSTRQVPDLAFTLEPHHTSLT
jgi:hypothetical protein